MLDGTRSMPSGWKSAKTYVTFAAGVGLVGGKTISDISNGDCNSSKEFWVIWVRNRKSHLNRCHGRPKTKGSVQVRELGGKNLRHFPSRIWVLEVRVSG